MESDIELWWSNPAAAFARWQEREAAGADRKPFSTQSIVQHRAMFDRIYRFLLERGLSLATAGVDHVDAFLAAGGGFAEDTTTRIRYAKLMDRLFRHLTEIGYRKGNPAFDVVNRMRWPEGDPEPAYLDDSQDAALQEHVQPAIADDPRMLRNRAIVAVLLGTGVTVTEFLRLTVNDLMLQSTHPYLSVSAHGGRSSRTVQIEPFAVPVLEAWIRQRAADETESIALFPNKDGKPLTVATLGNIVRDALTAIDVEAEDMSPRLLRNTDCRRRLSSGQSAEEVTYRLGLTTNRTVERMLATLNG
ncbi:Tyrosine recombinase XerC (plasmid) [Pararobbsia alpina]|uniref:tyrosine-type recombinase/integrase n=1 Tax=Pararobbsia alpina TaxID=621374 RepID=UPI0039A7229F